MFFFQYLSSVISTLAPSIIFSRRTFIETIFTRVIFTTKENASENFLDEQTVHTLQGILFEHN
jgi:hypothetical protein